jgi:hypothetical protein
LSAPPSVADQAYVLKVSPDGVTVTAGGEAGERYALAAGAHSPSAAAKPRAEEPGAQIACERTAATRPSRAPECPTSRRDVGRECAPGAAPSARLGAASGGAMLACSFGCATAGRRANTCSSLVEKAVRESERLFLALFTRRTKRQQQISPLFVFSRGCGGTLFSQKRVPRINITFTALRRRSRRIFPRRAKRLR